MIPARLLGILLALSALPLPLLFPGQHGFGPPEDVWPAFWLLAAAAAALVALVADYSRPLAVFMAYILLRTAAGLLLGVHDLAQQRAISGLSFVLAGALLYALIARLHWSAGRTLQRAILGIAAVQLVLGVLDMNGVHPWAWKSPHNAHLPHGLLGHPNHWGLYMALALPALYAEIRAFGTSNSGRTTHVYSVVPWLYGKLHYTKILAALLYCKLHYRKHRHGALLAGCVLLGPLVVALSHSMAAIVGAALVSLLTIRKVWARARAVPVWVFYGAPMLVIAAVGYALRNLPLGGRSMVWRLAGEAFVGWPWLYQAFGTNLGSWWLWASWSKGPLLLGSPAHSFPGQGYTISWWQTMHSDRSEEHTSEL